MTGPRFQIVFNVAREEALAIIRSPGYVLAALSPVMVVIGLIVLMALAVNEAPYKAISVQSDEPGLAEGVSGRLASVIGPEADLSRLRGADAAFWIPTAGPMNISATLS